MLLAASISGAGADATNTILTKTRAFLLDSAVRAATDVSAIAIGAATINALVTALVVAAT